MGGKNQAPPKPSPAGRETPSGVQGGRERSGAPVPLSPGQSALEDWRNSKKKPAPKKPVPKPRTRGVGAMSLLGLPDETLLGLLLMGAGKGL
jgi:hypothetical protein